MSEGQEAIIAMLRDKEARMRWRLEHVLETYMRPDIAHYLEGKINSYEEALKEIAQPGLDGPLRAEPLREIARVALGLQKEVKIKSTAPVLKQCPIDDGWNPNGCGYCGTHDTRYCLWDNPLPGSTLTLPDL